MNRQASCVTLPAMRYLFYPIALILFVFGLTIQTASAQDPIGDMFQAVNDARQAENLPPLVYNARLQAAALEQATYMALIGEITHWGSEGDNVIERVQRVDYQGEGVSQLLFDGFVEYPQDAISEWLRTVDSKSILLADDLHEVGIAQVQNEETGVAFWCVVLGQNNALASRIATSREKVGSGEPLVAVVETGGEVRTGTAGAARAAPEGEPTGFIERVTALIPQFGQDEEEAADDAAVVEATVEDVEGENSAEASAFTLSLSSEQISYTVAAIALVAAAGLVYTGYQAPKSKRDPLRRRN